MASGRSGSISRVLPILNAIGCMGLAGLAVFQWGRERNLDADLHRAKVELQDSQRAHEEEKKRVVLLERDIGVLKESIGSLQKAAEQSAADFALKEQELAEFRTGGEAMQAQLKVWEEAVASRDAKLKELDAVLVETRKRLDEAVAKLKQAGAR